MLIIMEGWIKIHRELFNWEWYQDSECVHLLVHLILSANHCAKKWRGIEVKRGQLITGLHSLSSSTGMSIRSLRTRLERLETSGEIEKKTTKKYTLITVLKYEKFKIKEDVKLKPTNKRQTNDNKQE